MQAAKDRIERYGFIICAIECFTANYGIELLKSLIVFVKTT